MATRKPSRKPSTPREARWLASAGKAPAVPLARVVQTAPVPVRIPPEFREWVREARDAHRAGRDWSGRRQAIAGARVNERS